MASVATLAILGADVAAAKGVSGPYLAGRKAMAENDFQAAAQYFTRAMTQDLGNIEIMESAVLAYIGTGDFAGIN